ncbi:MAG: hypothetical protein HGA71_08205 [Azonexaceae bacterium]|nr:hypothetical protein [Azonexaceae bacterium]
MTPKTIALVVASALAVTACGNKEPTGAGIGVTGSIEKANDASSTLETKSGVTNDAKAGNTVAAAITARNVIAATFVEMTNENEEGFRSFPFQKVKPKGLFPYDQYGPTAPKADKDGNRLAPTEYQREQMVWLVTHYLSPVIGGWPVTYGQSLRDLESYQYLIAVTGVFVKNLYGLLLPYVPVTAARQPLLAQQDMRKVWNDIPTKELCDIWEKSIAETRLRFNNQDLIEINQRDATAPIQFKIGLLEIHGDAKGFAYSQAGIPMFDEQHLGGRKIELAMDRGESTTASTGVTGTQSVGAGNKKAVSGSVDLKSN